MPYFLFLARIFTQKPGGAHEFRKFGNADQFAGKSRVRVDDQLAKHFGRLPAASVLRQHRSSSVRRRLQQRDAPIDRRPQRLRIAPARIDGARHSDRAVIVASWAAIPVPIASGRAHQCARFPMSMCRANRGAPNRLILLVIFATLGPAFGKPFPWPDTSGKPDATRWRSAMPFAAVRQ